jgi:hypothetical protein
MSPSNKLTLSIMDRTCQLMRLTSLLTATNSPSSSPRRAIFTLSRDAEVTQPYKRYYQLRGMTGGEFWTPLFTSGLFFSETENSTRLTLGHVIEKVYLMWCEKHLECQCVLQRVYIFNLLIYFVFKNKRRLIRPNSFLINRQIFTKFRMEVMPLKVTSTP